MAALFYWWNILAAKFPALFFYWPMHIMHIFSDWLQSDL